MVNKVLGAYMAIDFLFVVTGAIMIGFCVIVKNTMFEVPTDGTQAVRNLLYQEFPLTGTCFYHLATKWLVGTALSLRMRLRKENDMIYIACGT